MSKKHTVVVVDKPCIKFNADNKRYEVFLDKNGIVFLSIGVSSEFLDRNLFDKGERDFASCWKRVPRYKTIAFEILETVNVFMENLGRSYTREDFKDIPLKDYSKYQGAIGAW